MSWPTLKHAVLVALVLCTTGRAAAFVDEAVDCGRLGKTTAELPRCCRSSQGPAVTQPGYGCCAHVELTPAPAATTNAEIADAPSPDLEWARSTPGVRIAAAGSDAGVWAPSYARPPPLPIATEHTVLLL